MYVFFVFQSSSETSVTSWFAMTGTRPATVSSPALCNTDLTFPTVEGSYTYRVQMRPGRNYVTAAINGDNRVGKIAHLEIIVNTGVWITTRQLAKCEIGE
jgi:hypothetical protein